MTFPRLSQATFEAMERHRQLYLATIDLADKAYRELSSTLPPDDLSDIERQAADLVYPQKGLTRRQKFNRELKRLLSLRSLSRAGGKWIYQLSLLSQHLWHKWANGQRRRDASFTLLARQTAGLARQTKACVCLTFGDLSQKTAFWEELASVEDLGHQVIIVHNIPILQFLLGRSSRPAALPKNWLYWPRPNIGYDFGGYRDTLMRLKPSAPDLKSVFLLNDSFTMLQKGGLGKVLTLLCTSARDFSGLSDNSHAPLPANAHLGSYCLHFSDGLLAKAQFWQFWEGLAYHHNKMEVIAHGEKGLSRHIAAMGVSCDGLYGNCQMDFAAMDGALLKVAADDFVITMDDLSFAHAHAKMKFLVPRLDLSVAEARRLVVDWLSALQSVTVTTRNFSIFHSRHFGFPIVKNDFLKVDGTIKERAKRAYEEFLNS